MKRALVQAGLYDDEAEAMLETWKGSYFQRPGLRLFYLVPQAWVRHFLPLVISQPHELTACWWGGLICCGSRGGDNDMSPCLRRRGAPPSRACNQSRRLPGELARKSARIFWKVAGMGASMRTVSPPGNGRAMAAAWSIRRGQARCCATSP